MAGIEKWLKNSRMAPLRIAGEIIFGTEGEQWENVKRLQQGE